jgi:peptidoglycan/LPS O-acetylase OafA/YrhL
VNGPTARLPTILPLTGLRAFAASWVVLYHFRDDIKRLMPRSEPAWPFLDAGYVGVDIFFILSGFIITYTYLGQFGSIRARGYGRFLWLRLARIYPVHLFTLAIFASIVVPGHVQDVRPGDILDVVRLEDFRRQIVLLHAWGTTGNHAWNYPAWSISAEWLAYLVFPVAALGLARVVRPGAAWAGVAAALAFNLATFLAIDAAGMTGDIIWVRILGEFGAGCFLFLLWRDRRAGLVPWRVVTPALVFASIVATMAFEAAFGEIAPVLAAPLYGFAILGLAHQQDRAAWFMALRPLVYLGEASYSLYMTHAIVQRFTWEYVPSGDFTGENPAIRLLVLAGYAVLLLGAAVLTYELVEQPARNLMRRVTDRGAAPRPGISAAWHSRPWRWRPARHSARTGRP